MGRGTVQGKVVGVASLVDSLDIVGLWVSSAVLISFAVEVRAISIQWRGHAVIFVRL
jgi:hypothetical protein